MAQARPGIYDLSSTRSPRVGLTRSTIFQGPHAHRFDSQNARCKAVKVLEQKEVDIDAPPQDSSEEEQAPFFEAEDYGQASDTTDSDSSGKSRSSQQVPSTAEPSGRHSNSCSSNKKSSQKQGSQLCGQKRKAEQVSDDEATVNISFQTQKRTAGYGKHRAKAQGKNMAVPVGGRERKGPIEMGNSAAAKEGVSAFIRPPTDGLLAELEKQTLQTISSNPSSPSRKSTLPSKRSGRLESEQFRHYSPSQSERPIFKAPQLSGQAPEPHSTKSRSNKNQKLSRKGKSSRTHRSSRELKPITASSELNVGLSGDSAIIAARKLGLEEATFRIPSSLPSVSSPTDKASASSGISSPPTSLNDDTSFTGVRTSLPGDESLDSLSMVESASKKTHKPKCPMCNAIVDGLFLEGFAQNRRLTVREQAKFCQAHQRRTADAEWQAKGYPTIDWSCLHMQVKIHSEAIDEILKGERFSYYRNAYDDFLKREKHKTMQQSLIQGSGIEDFSPGYYGSRGARIMIDNLMANFASKLRRRSSSDQLISARGVTNYVRAVLVPELATLLVMDDMNIDAEEARKVLRESVELGNLLNEEQDEVIKDPDTDDIS